MAAAEKEEKLWVNETYIKNMMEMLLLAFIMLHSSFSVSVKRKKLHLMSVLNLIYF